MNSDEIVGFNELRTTHKSFLVGFDDRSLDIGIAPSPWSRGARSQKLHDLCPRCPWWCSRLGGGYAATPLGLSENWGKNPSPMDKWTSFSQHQNGYVGTVSPIFRQTHIFPPANEKRMVKRWFRSKNIGYSAKESGGLLTELNSQFWRNILPRCRRCQ